MRNWFRSLRNVFKRGTRNNQSNTDGFEQERKKFLSNPLNGQHQGLPSALDIRIS